jgi:hypothetical protein
LCCCLFLFVACFCLGGLFLFFSRQVYL